MRTTTVFQKILLSLGVALLFVPTVFLLTRPVEKSHAVVIPLIPNLTTLDLPREKDNAKNIFVEGAVGALYGAVKSTIHQIVATGTQYMFESLASGNWGENPLYQQETWENFAGNAVLRAGSGFIQGLATGIDRDTRKTKLESDIAQRLDAADCDAPHECAESGLTQEEFEKCEKDKLAQELECNQIVQNNFTERAAFQANERELRNRRIQGDQGAIPPGARTLVDAFCKPSADINFRIMLPYITTEEEPLLCNVKEAWENWTGLLDSTGIKSFLDESASGNLDGWKMLRSMVSPQSNDLGYSFNVSLNHFNYTQEQGVIAAMTRREEYPTSPLKDFAGNINTPSNVFDAAIQSRFVNSDSEFQVMTGHIAADIITTVVGTLTQEISKVLFKGKGLSGGKTANLTNAGATPFKGTKGVQARLARLTKNTIQSGAHNIDVLGELQSSDCAKGGPNACVLGKNLALAVEQHMTVSEAVEEYRKTGGSAGLNPEATFGFDKDGIEPPVNRFQEQPLSYRAMVIMRKYRILPVSWELTALYIRDHRATACGGNTCTLREVMANFSQRGSPFFGLIDPNWVLKLPLVQCNLKGYGPQPTLLPVHDKRPKFDTNGDGQICYCDPNDAECKESCPESDDFVQDVARPEICVDERSCLEDDERGKCKDDSSYGYCLEEKRVWGSFEAQQCEEKFVGCQLYVNAATNERAAYIKNSLLTYQSDHGDACKQESAGCRWLSAKRVNTSWSTDDKVYLAGSAEGQKCEATQEGCTALKNSTGQGVQYKLAPDYLGCNGSSAAEKPECRQFATQCLSEHKDCKAYTPSTGEPRIAATSLNTCREECVGLTEYTAMPSKLETGTSQVFFIASKASQCSAVGCDQYTNIDVTGDAERISYFSDPQRCESIPSNPTVFNSWEGAPVNGFKFAEYNLAADASGAPACGNDNIPCVCSKALLDNQASQASVGEGRCKEFIDKEGKPWYRFTNNLIYQTADCHPYRNENDGKTYSLAASMSARCLPKENKCREYQSPQAGNVEVVHVSSFEGKTTGRWQGVGEGTVIPSSESSVLNGQSMLLNTSGELPLTFNKNGGSYTVSFLVKTTSATTINVDFYATDGTTNVLPFGDKSLSANTWTSVKFGKSTQGLPGSGKLRITSSSRDNIYIDDIVVTRRDGVVHAIKDSWVASMPDSCIKDRDARATNLGCQVYKDDESNANTYISSVNNLCPIQVVGCQQFTEEGGPTRFLVADSSKQCAMEAVGCTAYGEPKLNTEGDVVKSSEGKAIWFDKFYKIRVSEARSGSHVNSCAPSQTSCQEFKGVAFDSTISGSEYYRDPKRIACTYDESLGKYIKNVCSAEQTRQCFDNSDCVGVGECTAKVNCGERDVKSCPARQNTCRLIRDPECSVVNGPNGEIRSDLNAGTSTPCTPKYFVLDGKLEGECNGAVDPAKGCILVKDNSLMKDGKVPDLYNSEDIYDTARAKGESVTPSAATQDCAHNKCDANRIISVKVDRQCKTWLACTSSMTIKDKNGKDRTVCFQRKACDQGSGDTCTHLVPNGSPSLNVTIPTPFYARQSSSVSLKTRVLKDLSFPGSYLSGLSKPVFDFDQRYSSPDPGHNGYLDKPEIEKKTLYTVLSLDSGRPSSELSGIAVNSCRLYPQPDSPDVYQGEWKKIVDYNEENGQPKYRTISVDACYYYDQNLDRQQGLYGYCLEPYPEYKSSYADQRLVPNGFHGLCLNWYPVDYINGQYDALNLDQSILPYKGAKPLYYCLQSLGGIGVNDIGPDGTQTTGKQGYRVITRQSSAVGVGAFKAEFASRASTGSGRIGEDTGDSGRRNRIVNYQTSHDSQMILADIHNPIKSLPANGIERNITRDRIAYIRYTLADFSNVTSFNNVAKGAQFNTFEEGDGINQEGDFALIVRSNTTPKDVVNKNDAFTRECVPGVKYAAIKPQFDSNNKISGWDAYYCDRNDFNAEFDEWMAFNVTVYLKDYCEFIAQVVTPSGESVPFYKNIQDTKGMRGSPKFSEGDFGEAILPPNAATPELWDPIPIIMPTRGISIAHAQAMSVRNRVDLADVGRFCAGGSNTGKPCSAQANVCGSGGYCLGVYEGFGPGAPWEGEKSFEFAILYLQRHMFRKIFNVWQLKDGRYINVTDKIQIPGGLLELGIENPAIQLDPKQSDKPAAPKIYDEKGMEGQVTITKPFVGNSRVLSFFAEPGSENQLPLKKIVIDWDDNGPEEPITINMSSAGRKFGQGKAPYQFTHTYQNEIPNFLSVYLEDNWGAHWKYVMETK